MTVNVMKLLNVWVRLMLKQVIESRKRYTLSLDKCCGSDVKREDCECPPIVLTVTVMLKWTKQSIWAKVELSFQAWREVKSFVYVRNPLKKKKKKIKKVAFGAQVAVEAQ